MNLVIHGFNLRVVNVYSPTDSDDSENKKDIFYRLLKKAAVKQEKHQKLIVTGDFNATTSIAYKNCNFDGKMFIPDEKCNGNGSRLKGFCRASQMGIASTFFDYPSEDRWTWISPDKKTKKVLDYTLVQSYVQQYITECKATNKIDFDSDHRMLKTTLHTPKTRKARKYTKTNRKILGKRDLKSLFSNPDATNSFNEQVKMSLIAEKVDKNSPELLSSKIVNILNKAGESLPLITKDIATEWWKNDKQFNMLLDDRSKLDRGSREYLTKSKEIKKRIQILRNEKLKSEAEDINKYANQKEIEKLFRSIKKESTAFADIKTKRECDPNKLKEYFARHFSDKDYPTAPEEFDSAPDFIRKLQEISKNSQIKTEAPDEEELKSVINKLKNGKSANDVPTAYIKCALKDKDFLNEIVLLYQTVWATNYIPIEWGHSKLVALWKGAKKGKIDDPTAYRALQIGSSLCKIMVVVIIERIKIWYEKQLLDQQQGFRKDRGTVDAIYNLKQIHNITDSMKKPVFLLFIDLTAAFDHVVRSWLFSSISQRSDNQNGSKLFELIKALYSKTTTALSQTPDDKFDVKCGVRQGGPESPMLYNLLMDYVMRVYIQKCKQDGIKFLNLKYKIPEGASKSNIETHGFHILDWIGYADDLTLMFEDLKSLRKGLGILNKTFERFGLTINISKTKTMIINYDTTSIPYPETIASLSEEKIENVKEFPYLGYTIKYDEATTGDKEIDLRIDLAESKFYELGGKLMNKKILLCTRMKLLDALVRSRLTYACQSWTVNQTQMQRLTSCYCSMIRKMIKGGYRREKDSWRFCLSNDNLLKIAKSEGLEVFVRRQQRNYAAHIIRKENESTSKRLMFNANPIRKTGPRMTLLKTAIESANESQRDFIRKGMNRVY